MMTKKDKIKVSLVLLVALFLTVIYCCKQQRMIDRNNVIIEEYRELGIY